jgi:hypothetical protein
MSPQYKPLNGKGLKDVPIVVLYCDFHYVKTTRHFEGVDLAFVRHFPALAQFNLLGRRDVKRLEWLPFSFNPKVCDSSPGTDREASVFFSGARQRKFYPVRSDAIDNLKEAGLLSDKSVLNGYLLPDEYYQRMNQVLFGLACVSIYRLSIAKQVEIAAAGCCLLTDSKVSDGMDRLFPSDMYVRYSPETVVDIVKRAKDPSAFAEFAEIGKRAQAWAHEHHSLTKRAEEMSAIIKEEGLI